MARAIHRRRARARRALRRGQLRGDPRGADRERAVRPREGRLHRRARTPRGASSSWPTAARLFLDEIGDMSLATQAKVLRVARRSSASSASAARSPSRSTCASSPRPTRTSRRRSASGRFREDLFFRLNVIPIHVPPLRERRDDVPLLARHFLRPSPPSTGAGRARLAEDVLERLVAATVARQRARAAQHDRAARHHGARREDRDARTCRRVPRGGEPPLVGTAEAVSTRSTGRSPPRARSSSSATSCAATASRAAT